MNWFPITLLSITVNALGEIAQKISVTAKENLSAVTINFYVSVSQTILAFIYLIATREQFDPSLSFEHIIYLIIGGVLSFFFFTFLYTSYKGNSASLSQVIFSLSALVSTILGIIIFGESKSIEKFIGIILILIGVIIANYQKGSRFSKYNFYAIIAALIFGFLTNIDKAFSTTLNIHFYQVLYALSFAIVSLIISGKTIIKETKMITSDNVKTILISTIAFTIFNKLTFLAYSSGGEVGRVDAINNTVIFLIIALEYLILKDRSNMKKKILSAVISVSGVVILGFVK